jgi:hypothetical protein
MSIDDGNDAADRDEDTEVLDALPTPVQSFDELREHYQPAVVAAIWRTCCWSERMGSAWNVSSPVKSTL